MYEIRRGVPLPDRKHHIPGTVHFCARCKTYKPVYAFSLRKDRNYAVHSWCKACKQTYDAAHHAAHALKRREANSAWHKTHHRNTADRSKTYRLRHPDKKRAERATRRAREMQACPKWLSDFDRFVIFEAYDLSRRRKIATGLAHHVDHVVPLRGKYVCGLHVASNLQVIPATINLRKGRKHL